MSHSVLMLKRLGTSPTFESSTELGRNWKVWCCFMSSDMYNACALASKELTVSYLTIQRKRRVIEVCTTT